MKGLGHRGVSGGCFCGKQGVECGDKWGFPQIAVFFWGLLKGLYVILGVYTGTSMFGNPQLEFTVEFKVQTPNPPKEV